MPVAGADAGFHEGCTRERAGGHREDLVEIVEGGKTPLFGEVRGGALVVGEAVYGSLIDGVRVNVGSLVTLAQWMRGTSPER